MTDEQLVNAIWHEKVEHNHSWRSGAEYLKMHLIEISPQELKKRFLNYFKQNMGIAPYTKCPLCQSELTPKKKYSIFIGCSAYPKCKFTASKKNPYIANK